MNLLSPAAPVVQCADRLRRAGLGRLRKSRPGSHPPVEATPAPVPAPDTVPTLLFAADPAPTAAKENKNRARRETIDASLLEIFVRGTRFRQRVGALLMGVFVVFCWGHAPSWLLLAWLAAGLGLLAVRHQIESAYEHADAFKTRASRLSFVRRMHPVYALHGGLWGLSLLFCFERIPVYDQMGCWLVLACTASAPLTSVALVPKLMRAYTDTLFGVLITVMLGLVAVQARAAEAPHLLLLALPPFYWWLLGRFGKGILQNQREQSGLQWDIRREEQVARAAIETKDRFLASAAHDLRQPVMALSLYAEHLVEFPEMHLELAPKIAVASQAVKGLFESLFDLANLDSGQVRLQVEPMEVGDLLRSLKLQFEPLAQAKDIELRVRATQAVLRSDRVRLQRMVGNVLGNAIKYSPRGRKILMSARPQAGGGVCIEVWDQGFGIPKADLGKVFEEFYRVDRPGTASIDGVGLGLSIVSRLSRVLGATIRISSVVGSGTRFRMQLADLDDGENSPVAPLDIG